MFEGVEYFSNQSRAVLLAFPQKILNDVENARERIGQRAGVTQTNGQEERTPAVELRGFVGGLDLEAEHFAVNGVGGKNGDDGVGGVNPSLDLAGPFDAQGEVLVGEDGASVLGELAFENPDQGFVGQGVPLIQQNHFRCIVSAHRYLKTMPLCGTVPPPLILAVVILTA